ncbi:hypothetical protein EBU99_13865 [bacterium]|nr:hypothetical protein [bacterium]
MSLLMNSTFNSRNNHSNQTKHTNFGKVSAMQPSALTSRTLASKIRSLAAFLLLTLAFTPHAHAEELIWNNVVAYGSGDGSPCRFNPQTPSQNNVIWTAAGGDLSIILTNWSVSLPKIARLAGGKLTTSSICTFDATVTIPRGYYLKTLSQTLVTGVMKDKLVSGGITSNGFLFQTLIPLNQINMIFRPDQALSNALLNVNNTQIITQPFIQSLCQASRQVSFTTKFRFQLVGVGIRPFPQLGLQANVDGSDVHFGLDSSLERCP